MVVMKIHIVYAHPHAASLNAALRDEAVQTLEGLGHTVTVSDLYAMRWNPVADFDDFGIEAEGTFVGTAVGAFEADAMKADIKAEQEKLLAADAVVLQFPLWWFTVPAIMKGWIDRVFNVGFGYGVNRAWKRYGDGVLAGKRAMVLVTTGAAESHLSDRGINGSIDDLLFPLQHGVLFYTGMQVLPPEVVTGAHLIDESGYADTVKRLRSRLETLAETEPIAYRKQAEDYDEDKRLKPGLEPEGATGFALHLA